MIRDWEEHGLNMDFSHIGATCSDIDMFHVTKTGFLIIGEIKNAKGKFKDEQKRLLSRVVDANKYGGAVLYITHRQDVHAGDRFVDVARCRVDEIYWNGEWIKPSRYTTVNEAIGKIERSGR